MAVDKKNTDIVKGLLAGLGGGGLVALITWLASRVEAAPPDGVTVFTPDEWTKNAILGVLQALKDEISLLDEIKVLLGGEPAVFAAKFEVTPISAVTIPGLTPKELYLAESPHSGSIVAIEIVSNSRYIEYELHLDDMVWKFNVSDMIDASIEYPHFPGGWIAKATGATFVFLFSSGGAMDVKYQKNFSLIGKATTAANVTISRAELVRKVYESGE